MVLSPYGETGEQFIEQPKGEEYMEMFQYHNKDILTTLKNLFHQVRDDWKSQSYRALHYQHEQFEIAVQEQQREAFDQVEIAVALATSRTAVQMTSRFRDIENHVEANFSHHQTEFLSQITSLSVRALEAQRHTLVQEPTTEMIRRDAHCAEVLSHFGSELQRYHLHAEVQSDEFNNLKQN